MAAPARRPQRLPGESFSLCEDDVWRFFQAVALFRAALPDKRTSYLPAFLTAEQHGKAAPTTSGQQGLLWLSAVRMDI